MGHKGQFGGQKGRFGDKKGNFGTRRANSGDKKGNFGARSADFGDKKGNLEARRADSGDKKGNFGASSADFRVKKGNFGARRADSGDIKCNLGAGEPFLGENPAISGPPALTLVLVEAQTVDPAALRHGGGLNREGGLSPRPPRPNLSFFGAFWGFFAPPERSGTAPAPLTPSTLLRAIRLEQTSGHLVDDFRQNKTNGPPWWERRK